MKITKFAKLVKKSGRCEVVNVYGEGVWLSDGHAIYKATQLPELDDVRQVMRCWILPRIRRKVQWLILQTRQKRHLAL